LRFRKFLVLFLFLTIIIFQLYAVPTVRIKDIAYLMGVRSNQLLGMGIVTGLAGKGDSSSSSLLKTVLSNLLSNFDLVIEPNEIKSKNCAVVMVNADLPSFARSGDNIDLHVSSIGDAKSLEGGMLLQTNLKAANGKIYAVAQGRVVAPAGKESLKTVGTVARGAMIEREVLSSFVENNIVRVVLRNPDFVTANNVAAAFKTAFTASTVNTIDAAMIEVSIPEERQNNIIGFIAQLETISIIPDIAGKVVIDPQSDIIIIGENVRIGKVAVSYKQMNVNVSPVFSDEETTPENFVFKDTTSVEDMVNLLREVGLKAETIMGILQAIEKAGALFGTLIII